MPNPNDYKSQNSFMSDCVTKLKGEGKTKAKAVEICNGMWYSNKQEEVTQLKENIFTNLKKLNKNG